MEGYKGQCQHQEEKQMTANYERNKCVGRQYLWVIGSPEDVPEMTAPKEERLFFKERNQQRIERE